jgi:HD-GYP domain-containing protein (c-di-GMP phosphodiesterase class II)
VAEKIHIADKGQAPTDKFDEARAHDEKLQNLGRALVASMYMLVRNVKLYEPENAIFVKPLEQLKDCINTIIAMEGKLNLVGAGNTFYLNNMLLKFDMRSFDNVRSLAEEFERRDVGGFGISKSVTVTELQNFIYIFSRENKEQAGERGVSARQLESLKVARFKKIKEILDKHAQAAQTQQQAESKLDRKRYGMLLYARLIQFMRRYIDGMRDKGPAIPRGKSAQVIQDLVDVVVNKKKNFMGMTSTADPWDAYCYHLANVVMLAIVFGAELGLTKEQLRDLGTAALFHDIGRVALGDDSGPLPEKPTDDAAARQRIQQQTIRNLLADTVMNKTGIHTLVAAHEHQSDAGTQASGLYSRIIALADCFDLLVTYESTDTNVVMEVMSKSLAHRFDHGLMMLFADTMTIWTAKTRGDGEKIELF